jgi:putative transposase
LKELAAARPRYGYLRLHLLLRREGWRVNQKRIYRLYLEEGLQVRTKKRRKCASHTRLELPQASEVDELWSMDFVSETLVYRFIEKYLYGRFPAMLNAWLENRLDPS